ncbi:MAG: homing endonuclease [Wendovervirus sonii]|uniref:Homing endonuclease n=1 Tax=phage Lak_Megaphage_Sonny TaxID=3109229 RepID=A0ABZ0Z437_9CAUD|nr:MAG: homing endonuclease [phage Lak_Megaphage_Sonny]
MEKNFNEIYEQYGKSAKSVMIALRNEDNLNALINETSFLPSDISVSERFYCWVNGLKEIPKCPVCGKPKKFHCFNRGYFSTCGDKACKSAMIAKSNKESYRDWDKIQEKMRKTYAEKHNGYTHNMQNPEFKIKFFDEYAKNHNGEKCGVCSEKAIEKRNMTFEENGGIRKTLENGIINKYGSLSECAKINNVHRAKIKSDNDRQQLIERLFEMGYIYISDESKNIAKIQCQRCNHVFSMSRQAINVHYRNGNLNFCPICDFKDMTFRSNFEKEVGNEIRQFYKGEILCNRYINGYECDIIIPEMKIAIECNGVYWHTEQYKEKDIHQIKKIKVEESGYNLIQIWEDDWKDTVKHDIIISRMKSKLWLSEKIYARKCIIKEVSGKEAKKFLDTNHIQGYVPASYKYGLFYNDELVEIITIGKTRKLISGNEKCLELYRLCTKKGYNVIGGFSKLLSYFRKNISAEKIISYADCDWCKINDNGYEKAGFKYIKMSSPGYYYNINGIRVNRINYTKNKLVKDGFDINKTEIEIMHDRGYFRIFDSGNLLFEIC